MKNILILLILISIQSFGQQTTTVKVPPSKDTTVVRFTTTTTTTSNTQTTYTTSSVQTKTDSTIIDPPPPPVTPGKIEGFGADVTGGAGSSTVYHVTNLNASGSGSLANGIGSNRTIVFDVSGTIRGRFYISGVSNLTIDAYTSKQDITIDNANNGDAMSIENSKNVLISGLRFINAGNDGLNIVGSSSNVVIDHCSSYGNADGNIDVVATSSSGKNFTVQWCFIGRNNGSGLMLITSQNASIHHNFFVGTGSGESSERMPYAHSNYSPVGTPPNFDFRNNLITKAGRYASGNGYKSVGNYVNNYYTQTKAGLINLCADNASCGTAYVSGNFNQPTATGGTKVSTEYSIPAKYKVSTTDARTAAQVILQNVGPWKKNAYEQGEINAIVIN